MTSLHVPIPPEMEAYRDDLEYFFVTMVRKLHVNRHKGVSNDTPIAVLMRGIEVETREVLKALDHESQFDAPLELADVANFAFLASRSIWHMTRAQFEANRKQINSERMRHVPDPSKFVTRVQGDEP